MKIRKTSIQCTNFEVAFVEKDNQAFYTIDNGEQYDSFQGIYEMNELEALEICEALADLLGYKLVENHSV